ncbi:hypothetical protein ACFPM3_29565 [Streptomyces coeruleoprunus]|uniref:Uncharacterized protein n=1 Tax=Streptomyces coeruleoprunus TaxID=285563 RepID=A0ABV9XNX2_9ACTN
MTVAAAVAPVAALRRWRGAAGRRAWAVALFLGGLLAIGFFCGSDARAVEQRSAVTVEETGQLRPAAEDVTGTVRRVVEPDAARDTSSAATKPVTEAAEAAGTAADAVHGVTAPVTDAPAAPVRPPVLTPAVPALPAPPQSAEPYRPVSGQQPGDAPRTTDRPDTAPAVAGAATATAFGTDPSGVAAAEHTTAAQPTAAPATVSAPADFPAPARHQQPCGGAALHTAGDSGSPRGAADQPAVTDRAGTPPGTAGGTGLPATAAPTCDRPHDILEFPG